MMNLDRYCVFGNPIAHSRSPDIHAHFANQCGDSIKYEKAFVELGEFSSAARAFFSEGGKGANVTVPFKEDAFHFADELSDRAKLAGALNTLLRLDDGRIFGDTTDGSGLVWDLCDRLSWQLEGKRVLILGAGGAAVSVMLDLLNQKPESIAVANRTLAKAEAIADKFEAYGSVFVKRFSDLSRENDFDLVINATSASLSGELPPVPESLFAGGAKAYDMVYAEKLTAFLQFARNNGAEAYSDGFGMLIGQAAESYYLWRQKRPNSEMTMRDLRS